MSDGLSTVSCIEETGEEFENLKKVDCDTPSQRRSQKIGSG